MSARNNQITINDLAIMVAKGFKEMDKRFADMDKKFDAIDKRFADMDKRFDEMDCKFDEMNDIVKEDHFKITNHEHRIHKVKSKLQIA